MSDVNWNLGYSKEVYFNHLRNKWKVGVLLFAALGVLVALLLFHDHDNGHNTWLGISFLTLIAVSSVLCVILSAINKKVHLIEDFLGFKERRQQMRHSIFCEHYGHHLGLLCHNIEPAEDEIVPPVKKLLGERDDTFNGMIYRLTQEDTGEVRYYVTLKNALDAFLADHKAPWHFAEINSSGQVNIAGPLQHWYGWEYDLLPQMRQYGYKLVMPDVKLPSNYKLRDLDSAGYFEKISPKEIES